MGINYMCPFTVRDELVTVKYKSRITALQEQVRVLEEAANVDTAERSKTLKDLATERGVFSDGFNIQGGRKLGGRKG